MRLCKKCNLYRSKSQYRHNMQQCHECTKSQKRDHYAKNSERINEDRKSPNGYFIRYKTQAKKRGLNFELTREHCYLLFSKSCFYCGDTNQVGIDRIDNSKGYTLSNVRSCCGWCNVMKWKFSEGDFFSKINSIQARSAKRTTKGSK